MDIEIYQPIIMYLSLFTYTVVLIWGLKLINKSFENKGTFLKLLSEDQPEPKEDNHSNDEPLPKPSFSRLAGAVGSMGLAAVFIGIGYWVIFALFNNGDLNKLDGLGTYFLSGSALFAPYAFNQLAKVFKL
jgi:hypothetical protein